MITLEYIKELVETTAKINNLEQKKRHDNIAWYRFVCFQLSKDFISKKEAPLRVIGDVYNRDHASVVNGLKQFENLFGTNVFKKHESVYKHCYMVLLTQYTKSLTKNQKSIIKIPFEIENYYRVRHINYSKKVRELFNSLSKKIDVLSKKEVFSRIAGLDDEDLADFELRANAFLEMKRIKNKYNERT